MINIMNKCFHAMLVVLCLFVNISVLEATSPDSIINKQIETMEKQLSSGIHDALDFSTVMDYGFKGVRNYKENYQEGELVGATGDTFVGEDLEIDFFVYPRSLDNINKQRSKNGKSPRESFSVLSTKYTLLLIAKNGNKEVKRTSVVHQNKKDNIIRYKVDKNVTNIEIKVWGDFLYKFEDGKYGSHIEEETPLVLKLTVKDKGLFSNVDVENSSKKVSEDGISTATIVGGAGVIGILGWGAMTFFGTTAAAVGAGASAGTVAEGTAGTIPRSTSVPQNPYYKKEGEDLIYTDPATGSQSIYSQDSEGNWVNRETGGVLDVGRADEVTSQRLNDAKWQKNTMKDMVDKDTVRANEEIAKAKNAKAQEQLEEYRSKIAAKYGASGESVEVVKEKIANEQGKNLKELEKNIARANTLDKAVVGLSVVQITADTSINIISKFVPGTGTIIANVYTAAKNIAGSTMEGAISARGEKGIWNKLAAVGKGVGRGVAKGGIECVQNTTVGKFRALANIGGEVVKSALDAGMKGEIKAKDIVSGLGKGVLKQGISMLSDKLEKVAAIQKNKVLEASRGEMKELWKSARVKQEGLINNYTKKLIECEKDAKLKAIADSTLYKGNPIEVATKMRDNLLKMNAQSFLKKADAVVAKAEKISSVIKSKGDLVQGISDGVFNDDIGVGSERWKRK